MNVNMKGKKFTASITFTRPVVCIVIFALAVMIWLPYHYLQNAYTKIAHLEKQNSSVVSKTTELNIQQPIVSPYSLSSESKNVLNEWLLYGMHNGYDKMLKKYQEVTQNQDDYKPFWYIIETEWRLGRWEAVKLN